MLRFLLLVLPFILFACKKEKIDTETKLSVITINHFNYNNNNYLIYQMDLNDDGIIDVDFTDKKNVDGSHTYYGLFIQGKNGASISYTTKSDSLWMIDIYGGTYDTLWIDYTYEQPTAYPLQSNLHNGYSDTLLTLHYYSSQNGPIGPRSQRDYIGIGEYKIKVLLPNGDTRYIRFKSENWKSYIYL